MTRKKASDSLLRPLVIPVFLPHAGCPNQCVYCNQRAVTGAGGPGPDPGALVLSEVTRYLEYSRPGRGPGVVSFFGGNFLGLPPKTLRLFLAQAQDLINLGKLRGIRFSTRPDTITPETLDLLQGHDVEAIELGVQSMDDTVLSLSRRGHTSACTRQAVALVKQRGFRLGLQMMTGLPGDSPEKSLETACQIRDLGPAFVRVYPTVVLEGSPLAQTWRNGAFAPASLENTVSLCAAIHQIFSSARIPIARMGLAEPDKLLASGAVLAGPLHPAFGHLVLSEVFFQKTQTLLKSLGPALPRHITLSVSPKNISRARGHKNQNLSKLRALFAIDDIRVTEDPEMGEEEIRVV